MATESDDLQKSSPIAVPTTFGAGVTVPAGGTAQVAFTVDQDTLIHGIEIQAEREVIVRIRIGASVGPQPPTVGFPVTGYTELRRRIKQFKTR